MYMVIAIEPNQTKPNIGKGMNPIILYPATDQL